MLYFAIIWPLNMLVLNIRQIFASSTEEKRSLFVEMRNTHGQNAAASSVKSCTIIALLTIISPHVMSASNAQICGSSKEAVLHSHCFLGAVIYFMPHTGSNLYGKMSKIWASCKSFSILCARGDCSHPVYDHCYI